MQASHLGVGKSALMLLPLSRHRRLMVTAQAGSSVRSTPIGRLQRLTASVLGLGELAGGCLQSLPMLLFLGRPLRFAGLFCLFQA